MLRIFFMMALLGSMIKAEEQTVKVMTFNVRYDSSGDRWTRDWSYRLPIIKKVFTSASIVGVQEALDNQVNDLAKTFPKYRHVGVGRSDGKKSGEYVPIFYNPTIWTLKKSGYFWFSDTPETPGSTSWGNSVPRMCTWARFVDKKGNGLYIYNSHFDHLSVPSRVKSAELLVKKALAREHKNEPVILMGDFNCTIKSSGMKKLLAAEEGEKSFVVDAYGTLHPSENGRYPATFNRWKLEMKQRLGKIDHIFTSPSLKLVKAEILNPSKNGAVASDHKPVRVEFEWN